MYRPTNKEDVQRFERAFEYRRASNIAEGANGDANTLDDQIYSAIYAIDGRVHSMDPPHLLDYDIHDLWHKFITAAKNYSRDNLKQVSLVVQILYLREMGTLTCGERESNIIAKASNGERMWTDLPWLIEDVCTEWRGSFANMSTDQRCSLASFIARLVAVGVGGDSFAGLALTLFKNTLEVPRKSAASEQSLCDDITELSLEELLPVMDAWIFYAPHKLKFLCTRGGKVREALGPLAISAGVVSEGFSEARWAFWTKRIIELGQCDKVNVSQEAASMVDQMVNMETYRPL